MKNPRESSVGWELKIAMKGGGVSCENLGEMTSEWVGENLNCNSEMGNQSDAVNDQPSSTN